MACIDCGCLEVATFNSNGKVKPRNRCATCHCQYNKARNREKRIEANPDNYIDCKNCEFTAYKTKRFCENCGEKL